MTQNPAHIAWQEEQHQLTVRHAAAAATLEAWKAHVERVTAELEQAKKDVAVWAAELKAHAKGEPDAELDEPKD